MIPYYSDELTTIYNCHFDQILPNLDFQVVITDPPYGISHPTNYKSRGRGKIAKSNDYPPVHGDDHAFDPSIWIKHPCLLWGANYYANQLPNVSGWLVWDKKRPDTLDQSTCELGWSNFVKGCRRFSYLWNGCMREGKEKLYHPTQKPIALMQWCLGFKWMPVGTILDPFMGSGSTLLAARQLGKKAIGIEINQSYCDITIERLKKESSLLI